MALEPYLETIKSMMLVGNTYEEISSKIFSMGLERGASVPSIKKFIRKHNLRTRGVVSNVQLEAEVVEAVQETGRSYGRRLMAGYLASKGVHASQHRVGEALKVVDPPNHVARKKGIKKMNPMPYNATYFGQKLHMDQNEKLVRFGVTYVMAIDGYSGKLVGHAVMPIKNNLVIYEEVYKSAVVNHGLWDQVRVDHGREFVLSLFIQHKLSGYRFSQEKPSFLQTKSTKNHRIERLWSEVNSRVTYPLKAALIQLEAQERLNMEDETVRFCVSSLTCQLASIGIKRFIEAWNHHAVGGRGIPNTLAEGGCRVKINADQLPTASEAADLYDADNGSSLTRESGFGRSPFRDAMRREEAERRFAEAFPDIAVLLEETVKDNYGPFQDAIMHLVHLSSQQD